MTAEQFAKTYAGKTLDVRKPGFATTRHRIVGYRAVANDQIIVEHSYGTELSRLCYDPVLTATLDTNKRYWAYKQHQFILPIDDNEITQPLPILAPKKDMSHYPHTCPLCGQSSYNAAFGGWIDCSSRACKNYAKEQ